MVSISRSNNDYRCLHLCKYSTEGASFVKRAPDASAKCITKLWTVVMPRKTYLYPQLADSVNWEDLESDFEVESRKSG